MGTNYLYCFDPCFILVCCFTGMGPWLGFLMCVCLTALGDASSVRFLTRVQVPWNPGYYGSLWGTGYLPCKYRLDSFCGSSISFDHKTDYYTRFKLLIVNNSPFSKRFSKPEDITTATPGLTDTTKPVRPTLYCGRRPGLSFSGRVVNGKKAKTAEFPWMAKIVLKPSYTLCGGSLIADTYVLSAGHCYTAFKDNNLPSNRLPRSLRGNVRNFEMSMKPSDLVVHFGAEAYNEKKPRAIKLVLEIILHPSYDMFMAHNYLLQTNDVALLRIEPVQFSKYIVPICLPRQSETVRDRTPLVVAGWGVLKEAQPPQTPSGAVAYEMPETLMKTTVSKISWAECRKNSNVGKFLEPQFNLTDWHILCLIGDDTDACQGDSGGGAEELTPDGNNVVQGIVSWGIGCNRLNHPAAYTRVASFVEFIHDNTKGGQYLPMKT